MELKWNHQYQANAKVYCSNRTFMELKYNTMKNTSLLLLCSNRTFMELKLSKRLSSEEIKSF